MFQLLLQGLVIPGELIDLALGFGELVLEGLELDGVFLALLLELVLLVEQGEVEGGVLGGEGEDALVQGEELLGGDR